MRNVQAGAKPRQSNRILHAAHYPWRVAEERPALRDKFQESGPILEPGAIDEAARRRLLGKLFKRADQALALKSGVKAALDKPVGGAEATRIQIVEKIGDERPVSGPSRGRRQRPPGVPPRSKSRRQFQAISRARAKASRKSRLRAVAEFAMRRNNPDSVLYFTLPMASGPIPRLPRLSSAPFAMGSSPSIPAGGTALTSAETSRDLAAASILAERSCTPAAAAQSATSLPASAEEISSGVFAWTAWTSRPNLCLISSAPWLSPGSLASGEGHFGALHCRDNAGCIADRAGRSKDQRFSSGPAV